MKKLLYILALYSIFSSCDTGNLTVIANIPTGLTEVSGIEVVPNSNLFWVIEDSGNRPIVYGLDSIGKIAHSIKILNAKNRDWEDLTSDDNGNLYIGDFGDNRRSRADYMIYKINDLKSLETNAELISFNLSDGSQSLDFEAFFIFNEVFYIFSKDGGEFLVYTVPTTTGNHTAELLGNFNLEGKNNDITSADISDDGTMILLLNHSKLWKLSGFNNTDFFSGDIKSFNFNHASQKEGICFGKEGNIYIADENSGMQGGNIYLLKYDEE